MKIAIFETEHFETAFTVIRLFDLPGNKITVYTSKETFARLNDLLPGSANRFNWEILPGTNRFQLFFLLHKKLKKQSPDLLWLNTVSSNHWLWAFILSLLRLKRIILTVHDINCLFEYRPGLSFKKAIIYWGKKWLIKRVNEYNVISDTMISYLRQHTMEKKIHNIPGAVYEDRGISQPLQEQMQLVVPGSVDPRRRNYEQVFELAAIAEQKKLFLKIVLLGGYSNARGREIINRAQKLRSEFCQIIAYQTQVVDQGEFDKQMEMAHFVFVPSVVHTKICGNIPEEYGKTKSSGNIFDVVKHAKPFIVPAALTIPGNLETGCFKYGSLTDIPDFLRNVIASPGYYDQLQKNVFDNSLQYTIQKVRDRNRDLFMK